VLSVSWVPSIAHSSAPAARPAVRAMVPAGATGYDGPATARGPCRAIVTAS